MLEFCSILLAEGVHSGVLMAWYMSTGVFSGLDMEICSGDPSIILFWLSRASFLSLRFCSSSWMSMSGELIWNFDGVSSSFLKGDMLSTFCSTEGYTSRLASGLRGIWSVEFYLEFLSQSVSKSPMLTVGPSRPFQTDAPSCLQVFLYFWTRWSSNFCDYASGPV